MEHWLRGEVCGGKGLGVAEEHCLGREGWVRVRCGRGHAGLVRRVLLGEAVEFRGGVLRSDHHVGEAVCDLDNLPCFRLCAGEEFQEILQLTGSLVFQEPLGAARLVGVPAEMRRAAGELGLLAGEEVLPGLVDERLVEEAVDDARVHPLGLCLARLKVAGDVLDVALARGVQGRAEAAGPVLSLAEVAHYFFRVRARLAAVRLFVVLVEGVGAPKGPVAAWLRARVLLPALVEFVLVALPVVLSLKGRVARRAAV